jgi:hypothetical protein
MNQRLHSPSFDDRFPDLRQFICELVDLYADGKINSWDELDPRVSAFFNPERMEQMESLVPHWQKMTSYLEGVTLTHVMCVFMGLYMLPEYGALAPAQQNLMQWIILLHDIEKKAEKGKRDPIHALRSAVTAAQRLPFLGFHTTDEYSALIDAWSDFTLSAMIVPDGAQERIPDKSKYPEILSGIDRLFGKGSAGALLIKTVLLHLSITVVKDWPSAAPLTIDEIKNYADKNLLPLLKVMMLADNEGWSMFYPADRDKQRAETLETYAALENLIL